MIKNSDSDSHCISWQVPKGSVQGEIMNDDDDGDDQSEIIMMIIMIMMGTLGLLNWQNCLKKLPGKANAWSFLKTAEHCLDLIFWKRPTLSFPPKFWQITLRGAANDKKYKKVNEMVYAKNIWYDTRFFLFLSDDPTESVPSCGYD